MLPLTEVVFRSILSFGGVRSRFHLFALYYIVPSCNVGHASTYGCHYYSSTGPGSETSPNSFGQILTQAHYLLKLQPFLSRQQRVQLTRRRWFPSLRLLPGLINALLLITHSRPDVTRHGSSHLTLQPSILIYMSLSSGFLAS